MPSYPDWPERWECLDGILKYDPHESEDIGGESGLEGVPLLNAVWIVVHGGDEDTPPRKPRWPKGRKKRRKKNRTKKRKTKRKR